MINNNRLRRVISSNSRGIVSSACFVMVVVLAAALLVVLYLTPSAPIANVTNPGLGLSAIGHAVTDRVICILLSGLIIAAGMIGLALLPASGPPRETVARYSLVKGHRSLQAKLERYKESYHAARRTILTLQTQLMAAREEERGQIARDLHDCTLGHLAAAGLMLMRLNSSASTAEEVAALDQAKGSLKQAAGELRALTFLMHPPALQSAGLKTTAEQFVEGFSQRTGISARVRVLGSLDRLPFDVQCCAFRVLQEAISNVHRHAHASAIRVFVAEKASKLILMVYDNGKGFPKAASARAIHLGVGIPGMHHRLHKLGGHLRIKRLPAGTSVRAYIPLPRSRHRLPVTEGHRQHAA